MQKLLYPGMRLKRWVGLLLLGLVLLSIGVAYFLIDFYRSVGFPRGAEVVTLQFLPQWLRGVLFLVAGTALCASAFWGLYRSLADVVEPSQGQGGSFLELIYRTRIRRGGPRVVCIGGGTGMPGVLRGLKAHTERITAVVTVGDDGGSSGRLRREHGILPPGDFRNNIVALAEVEPLMQRLFQYRFGKGTPSSGGGPGLEGHSFGNLFVLAMVGVTGNFEHAIRETSRVLAVKGTILPSTLEDVTIWARFKDGTEVEGEAQVPEVGKPIDRIFMRPNHPSAQPEAVKAILEADLVVLGPGSLYTSLIPNLLVDGIAKALLHTDALKVYVCNVATQPGETDGFDVEDHVAALVRHLPGGQNPIDVVLVNKSDGLPLQEGINRVHPRDGAGRVLGSRLVVADLVRGDQPWRHDPEKLGNVLVALIEGRTTR